MNIDGRLDLHCADEECRSYEWNLRRLDFSSWLFDGIMPLRIVKKDLQNKKSIWLRFGCPLEFIFKDISTVHNEPERLRKWAETAMAVVKGIRFSIRLTVFFVWHFASF